MQQMNCPKCGAPAEYGSRFCSNCGNSLQWGAPPPPPYGYQPPPNQPQPWGQRQQYNQQPGWNQPPPYNQAPPAWAGPRQSQQGYRGAMPQQKKFSMSIILLIILIVVIFTIGGIALATNGFSSSKPSSTATAPTAPITIPTPPAATTPPATVPLAPPPPAAPPAPALPTSDATQVTAAELISAYANDSLGATSKYQGNVYAISGTVTSVNSSSPPFLYLGDASAGTLEIQCSFSQGQEGTISMFEVGNKVKVEGRITNYNRGIIVVDHCRLVQ